MKPYKIERRLFPLFGVPRVVVCPDGHVWLMERPLDPFSFQRKRSLAGTLICLLLEQEKAQDETSA